MAERKGSISTIVVVIVALIFLIGGIGLTVSVLINDDEDQRADTLTQSNNTAFETMVEDPTVTSTQETVFTISEDELTSTPTAIQTDTITPTIAATPTLSPTSTEITPTATETTVITATPTVSTTPTPTSTPREYNTPDRYLRFGFAYERFLNESDLGITVYGFQVTESGTMWAVINQTESESSPNRVPPRWRELANVYATTWVGHLENNISGERPSELRVIEFNNRTNNANLSTFLVTEEDVKLLYNDEIEQPEYTSRWMGRVRAPFDREIEFSKDLAGRTGNSTIGG